MKRGVITFLALLTFAASGLAQGTNVPKQTKNFEIYWIDVEGGASTLFIAPTGESLLFDTGFPGNGDRDAKRIYAAAQNAGLRQLDHVVISHWHADHEGGLAALAKMSQCSTFTIMAMVSSKPTGRDWKTTRRLRATNARS